MAGKTAASKERIGRVGQRRQVVIPRKMLATLNLQEGDFVAFSQQANGVLVKPKYPERELLEISAILIKAKDTYR
jgi:bifunctional DNA-binding transcriptional regulator/antitoxin component of YhaV-PrlF toxin-antitoxin module